MAWFKVDDAFLMSSKVLSIPRSHRNEALGVWLQTAVWSAHEMKDGLIPAHILDEFGCTAEIRSMLVESHLWVDAERGCVLIHNWNKYQPTREELELKRSEVSQKRSEAGKRGMAARWDNKPITNDNNAITNDNPEPEPEPRLSKESLKRGTRLTADFYVTDEMKSWAGREVPGFDVLRATGGFIDYWMALPGPKALKSDWVATWRNWMRREFNSMPVSSRPVVSKLPSDASYYCPDHGWPKNECPRCAEVSA